ncbi:MAG: RNA-guided pseudouridylation complex pseudouridine synthase subunit Cbf5, partial [Candidatus Altiarchaeota archaeon]|nr:RNA-guided pseudouridylation complex pseudouridine synthase subunit Cbf5 [Candidatus Altiarchaeota archaeon]
MESELSGEILVKGKYETDPRYGTEPEKRTLDEHIKSG